ncbi:hypothetical protein C7457_1735 [Thermovibrio guaymasensis]|uniref:Restriction endonuclease n=1 Tax=Thermovibrio guaymasensis TaxID=240167 RepID=A0A420W596_9BACT|nr:hypothetical protein [Thermovibrio guaymasensis]RKQ59095.1 hypothetical protein C7457_1735 [Thermovibrio guaymasensis]
MGRKKIKLSIENLPIDSSVLLGYLFLKEAIKVLKSRKKRQDLRKKLFKLIENIESSNNFGTFSQEKKIRDLKNELEEIFSQYKTSFFTTLLLINTLSTDIKKLRKHLLVLITSLYFLEIKEIILEAKREKLFEKLVLKNLGMEDYIEEETKEEIHPVKKLQLQYDLVDVIRPYASRVAIAIFSEQPEEIYRNLSELIKEDSQEKFEAEIKKTYELLSSQFQNILFESVKQSDTSLSGDNYETRIENLLLACGIDREKIQRKVHEEKNGQEHDFLIFINDKKISIGAKRTQRERYKQYRPSKNVDLAIVFTLGIDLTEDKVKVITEDYNSYIFVADEVYEQKEFLKNNEKVKKVSEFPDFIKKFL